MIRRRIATIVCLALGACSAMAFYQEEANSGAAITAGAEAFIATLDDKQKETSVFGYDDKQRVDWHFIPKDKRKGLQVKHMNEKQRKAATALLKSTLSPAGYKKAKQVMKLEAVLAEFEKGRDGGPVRDTERYYFSIFGTPNKDSKWGLSIEGHHMSLNFVIDKNEVVSSTPSFFASNPATVMNETATGFKKGLQVLKQEEDLAFKLVQSLTDEQKKVAVIAEKAPREIRNAGTPQPPKDEKVGIAYSDLEEAQAEIMRNLVSAYAKNLPDDVGKAKIQEIIAAGPQNVKFAWAGAQKPGVGHYYRIQGPTFLIEFVNTQPDPKGNKANHIHCVWRDMKGDFALPVE